MQIITTQQLRSAYMELCFQQKAKLTAEQFQKYCYTTFNTFISILTASMIAGDLGVEIETTQEVKELAYA